MTQVEIVKVTLVRQNCTIISDPSREAVLVVDPGGDVELIFSALKGRSVEAILLTHGHFDHVGGASAMQRHLMAQEKRHVPILGPGVEDEFLLSAVTSQAQAFGLEGLENVIVDGFLKDGDHVPFLDAKIDVVSLPGHTPGHIVFVDAKAGWAVVGDTLFRGVIGRTDFPYGNHAQLIQGIKEKLLTLPDATRIFPGHGLPTTIGIEKVSNPYLV